MGNPVTNHLPAHLDSFLQDVAQMYGTISYSDMMDFHPTEEQKNELCDIYIKMSEAYEEDEQETNRLAQRIGEIVKQGVA